MPQSLQTQNTISHGPEAFRAVIAQVAENHQPNSSYIHTHQINFDFLSKIIQEIITFKSFQLSKINNLLQQLVKNYIRSDQNGIGKPHIDLKDNVLNGDYSIYERRNLENGLVNNTSQNTVHYENRQNELEQSSQVQSQNKVLEAGMDNATLILIIITAVVFVIILLWISVELSRRSLLQRLPEAEVKIHLAILKLEQKQAEKIAKNEYQRYYRVREQKLQRELRNTEFLQKKTDQQVQDDDLEIAKLFFTAEDLQNMGQAKDQVLEKVAKDPTIRRNLKKHKKAGFNENLNKFEIKSELTEDQNLSRNQMIRDRIRAHQIKNLIMMGLKRQQQQTQNQESGSKLFEYLRVHFRAQIEGKLALEQSQALDKDDFVNQMNESSPYMNIATINQRSQQSSPNINRETDSASKGQSPKANYQNSNLSNNTLSQEKSS